MKNKKTDESVRAGLEIEGDGSLLHNKNISIPNQEDRDEEMDEDETIHQQGFETTASYDEEDADDLVHREPPTKTIRDGDEMDPDDLVHRK